jgi:RES domain-containing protein
MKVYRLAKEKRGHYLADDLSGNGAAIAGGRWNPRGMRALHLL